MKIIKVVALLCVSLWSLNVWAAYFDAKQVVEDYNDSNLSETFWQWEAQGRLALIDAVVDDETLKNGRNTDTQFNAKDLALHLMDMQRKAYGVDRKIPNPAIRFIPLRGDANGIYIPSQQIIFVNSKMQWEDLPFERFAEVIFHENMHHIMSQYSVMYDKNDAIYNDFEVLRLAAVEAESGQNMHGGNLQEEVAYRSQRAARYAGIIDSDLSAWEMTTRMQEIRSLSAKMNN